MISVQGTRASRSNEPLPSERKFGILFALVFTLSGVYGDYMFWPNSATAALFSTAALFLAAVITAPNLLAPLNRAWFALGILLGKIVSPIVLGVIFFLLITPVAVVTRIFGRDELRLNKQIGDSYWVKRNPAGPDAKSFYNQF